MPLPQNKQERQKLAKAVSSLSKLSPEKREAVIKAEREKRSKAMNDLRALAVRKD
jgi:hypothetical protein